MLNFQMLQVQDIKEAAAVERRRRCEEERKKRIFNARSRRIGVDYDALAKQMQEKQMREKEERKLEDYYVEEQRRNAQLAITLETNEGHLRRKIEREINEFRLKYQKPEDRREFDLNDPNASKKNQPARISDNDKRLGISAAQKFEGEDLTSDARKKLQNEQTKAWLEQQVKEQRAAEKELKDAEDAYQAAVVARDERSLELDKLEKECHRQLSIATSNYNKSLIQQHEVQREIKKQQELEDNFAEMYNAVTGDMLTENPAVAESNFGPGRCIGYMYKGMSEEQRAGIRKDQIKQMEENKKKRSEEETMKKYWDDYAVQTGDTIAGLDQEEKMKKREMKKQYADYNKTLARAQRAQKDYLENEVYKTIPTADFFDQFNQSSR